MSGGETGVAGWCGCDLSVEGGMGWGVGWEEVVAREDASQLRPRAMHHHLPEPKCTATHYYERVALPLWV